MQKRGDEIARGWEQRPGATAQRLREALTACGVIRQDLFAQKAATLVTHLVGQLKPNAFGL